MPRLTLLAVLLTFGAKQPSAGQVKTILQAAPGFDQELWRVLQSQHVVVRELTLDGRSLAAFGLRIEYCDNVLVERVEALWIASRDVGGLTIEPEDLICPGSQDASLPSYGGHS